MKKGQIGVSTENIFPIIKKFLYSEHEIFLRELVSNAVDAVQKLKILANAGEYKGDISQGKVWIKTDTKAKTLTISDNGIGMTADEIDKYINQIAFSGANEFLEKYKNKTEGLIGHFGLGFYSSFMVAEKVEIRTKSYKENAQAVSWTCDGGQEYSIDDIEKENAGTDIILYLDKDSEEFTDESKILSMLNKYCRFLPVEIAFGKEKEWKDGKESETEKDRIINDTKPLWTRKPAELKEEDYSAFYSNIYPMSEPPLFHIHLNVDYPFNLTGVMYFPRIKKNIEIQKNKIQLYCNQVFVTDSVEGIVPDFLTLLHGVIDSPDIPLNVSRSYLQGDPNVKKISGHISKKVADRLEEIFKNDREQFEKKWDDLKLFIEYGIITEEKFYDRAEKFLLLKNTDNKYFTPEEYKKVIEPNQTDKDKHLIFLYATDMDAQYTYIETAKARGYDVLMMDGQLDTHFLNHLEMKMKDCQFLRVDSDVIDNLIKKEEEKKSKLSAEEKGHISEVFKTQLSSEVYFNVLCEPLSENDNPVLITQSEFMRRMKDMSAVAGGQAGLYGNMPDSYNIVVNENHNLISRIKEDLEKKIGEQLKKAEDKITPIKENKETLQSSHKDKKYDEIPQEEKDRIKELEDKIEELRKKKTEIYSKYAQKNPLVKQLIDLALLANNMLKGEDLNKFVKRSIELV